MFLGLTNNHPPGEVKPLLHFNLNKLLVNNDGIFSIISNVCPHQNARLTDVAVKDILTCPYHGLQFNHDGTGVDNDFCLDKIPCYTVRNMIFNQPVDFKHPIDLSYMELVESRIDIVNSSPEIVIDVFLDIDHIPIAHPGVYDAISITNISKIKYDFFNGGSTQYVTADDDQHIIEQDRLYNLGAVWTTVYESATTIEWQPGALFVNVALGNNKVLVYKYRDLRYSQQAWEVNNKTWESAWAQDRDLCERIVGLPMFNLDKLKLNYRNWIKNAV
jgi:phenylpropionate dioxygenase-like ring-hydroxylating dioxygenase large terminal subunit